MKKDLILFGNTAFAEIADEYFTHDSPYEVKAFTVHRQYIKDDTMRGKPVVPYEELDALYSPREHSFYAAVTYQNLNRLRSDIALDAKARGFELASYVSSHAFVWRNVRLGEHCFIFENNVLQPFVNIEDNVVLWSGNHIGHHSTIRSNVFISSHVVVSGFVTIGENCFLGVNSTIGNNVEIGRDVWISPSVAVTKAVPAGSLLPVNKTEPHKLTSYAFFKVPPPDEGSAF